MIEFFIGLGTGLLLVFALCALLIIGDDKNE